MGENISLAIIIIIHEYNKSCITHKKNTINPIFLCTVTWLIKIIDPLFLIHWSKNVWVRSALSDWLPCFHGTQSIGAMTDSNRVKHSKKMLHWIRGNLEHSLASNCSETKYIEVLKFITFLTLKKQEERNGNENNNNHSISSTNNNKMQCSSKISKKLLSLKTKKSRFLNWSSSFWVPKDKSF